MSKNRTILREKNASLTFQPFPSASPGEFLCVFDLKSSGISPTLISGQNNYT